MRKVIEVVGSLGGGGAERVAVEIAAGLAARPQAGWRVELLVGGLVNEAERTLFEKTIQTEVEKRGVQIHHVTFPTVLDGEARRRLHGFLIREHVDLVHVHNRPQDWQLVALCKLLGVPVLYTVHLPYPFKNLKQRLLYIACGRMVPRVVCVSQAVACQVHELELVPKAKIRVIYNGIRMDLFRPLASGARTETRRELGWSEDDFVWIMAARLQEQKGHKYLFEAIARLPHESRAKFALAGEGHLETELKTLAQKLGIAGSRVMFLGARRDVPTLLGAADGYACSSMQEGHPLSLLEAMAVELPVVAPRLRSIEEIALGDTPIFYGPKIDGWAKAHDPVLMSNAFLAVEKEPAEAGAKARNARSHVAKKFSLDAMITQHDELYREILDSADRYDDSWRLRHSARALAKRFLL